jgi:glycogen debranching enzyme
MDELADRRTFSQIVESNWTQPPSFLNELIIEVLSYVLYSETDGVIGQRHF